MLSRRALVWSGLAVAIAVMMMVFNNNPKQGAGPDRRVAQSSSPDSKEAAPAGGAPAEAAKAETAPAKIGPLKDIAVERKKDALRQPLIRAVPTPSEPASKAARQKEATATATGREPAATPKGPTLDKRQIAKGDESTAISKDGVRGFGPRQRWRHTS